MNSDSQDIELQQASDTVYSLAASPTFDQDGVCFAARTSGLYRSKDGGQSWEFAYASLERHQQLITTAVAVSPCFAQDHSLFAAVKGGILRSSDGGETWFTTVLSTPPPLISALAVSPNFEHDGTLLAGTMEDGVFSSSDRGVHWTPWNFGLFDLNVLSIAISPAFGHDETVYAGTESGLFRSTNGGRAWRATAFPSECAPVLCLLIINDSEEGNTIFAGTENEGLFCSTDQGKNWLRLAQETITKSINDLQAIHLSESDHTLLALVEHSVLISHDYGRSWSKHTTTDHVPTTMLAPTMTDHLLLIGLLDKGVLRLSED
jgi:photosystem II stability/assembly factor-like uncharacterized protein